MMASHPSTNNALPPRITVTPIPSPILPTKTLTTTILGHPTTVITQTFTDRIFITITQLNKFGCLYQASTSSSPSSSSAEGGTTTLPPPMPNTTITKLVGSEPTPNHTALYQLYVSQVASIVKHLQREGDERSVVVSLALKTKASAGAEGKVKQNNRGNEGDDEDCDGELMSSDEERKRFLEIIGLVQECRVW